MAPFTVLLMVVFFVFTLSHAPFLIVEPELGSTAQDTVSNLPDSDPRTTTITILLSGDRPGSEPAAKLVDFKPGGVPETDSDVVSVPWESTSFRPVNRYFSRYHHRFRPLNSRFHKKRYISYGDDMILSDERTRFEPELRRSVRQVQPSWSEFPGGVAESKVPVDFMKTHHHVHVHYLGDDQHQHQHHHHHYHHQHRRHHHHRRHNGEDKSGKVEEHVGGSLKRLTKFFIHF
ncbi:transcription factor ABORTED MICROSPORES-like [Gossypium arboreum]|uniref:Uncharacterized protein n=1 Tax=Gossypium arboreum TaxID=29729 RepID=A0ABR0MWU1_GOSAR|nr:transcription factor ABORTED MICROSPORES-like [Gossypium arboreum]KAK5782769.1 hypothetical protein PVK06_037274 [Gossypium arboreum]